jgi:hypothetical protein
MGLIDWSEMLDSWRWDCSVGQKCLILKDGTDRLVRNFWSLKMGLIDFPEMLDLWNIINTLFSHNFSLRLSLITRGHLSHAFKTTGEVTVLRKYASGVSKLTVFYQNVCKWTRRSDPHSTFTIESVRTRWDKNTVKILDLQNAQFTALRTWEGKSSSGAVAWKYLCKLCNQIVVSWKLCKVEG